MSRNQRGQAIVMVGLILVVLFGFLGLAMDGGRGYLDRRSLQASVDAASLAAAYNYMNTNDPGQAEQAATNEYANNQRLYNPPYPPSCTGYGTPNVTCSFGDPTNQVLTIAMVSHSIAGVTFMATARHQIGVTMMQVIGAGSTMTIGATATALARRTGSFGAAIQTLAPNGCGSGGSSLTFQGNSTTLVTGDIWSNGNVFDNSAAAGGSVTGNVVAICPTSPFLNTPTPWTVTGAQANGWNMPDPNYTMPTIDSTPRTWNASNGSTELAGTYANDPGLPASAGCYFLAGGVFDFAGGFTDNGGFVSNELRPPDEPFITTSSAAMSGTVTSIPVPALAVGIPANSPIWVAGQAFTVTSAAASGATSIPIQSTVLGAVIASGSTVLSTARSNHQFWDANRGNCGSTFSLSSPGSGSLTAGSYSVELTAIRYESTTTSSCSAQGPNCYLRESAPSMCRTINLSTSGNLKVDVTSDPGAADFNVYLAQNTTCTGLAFCSRLGSGTVSSCAAGGAVPPDPERPPQASSLPNTDPAAATPPHGDLGNESHCVDSSGTNAACPNAWTPGAVEFVMPGVTGSMPCLNLRGQGDIYIFSGYNLGRIVLYLPGPEQSSVPNTCANNRVNGNGFTSLIGILYMPAASVTINGNSAYQATIAGGVIAWTATVIGNGTVAITADPTLRSWPSTVRLIQ
ncbi:MAG TPA: TadE/TadG family type IV pilus assembly protein [Candidatus Dormibacteraeota bacterium]|nr:TadE/TadG family type IV pilus assembly protein [Candidatus Dormibacteraeota bacterium]